jgi:hypothetical protein
MISSESMKKIFEKLEQLEESLNQKNESVKEMVNNSKEDLEVVWIFLKKYFFCTKSNHFFSAENSLINNSKNESQEQENVPSDHMLYKELLSSGAHLKNSIFSTLPSSAINSHQTWRNNPFNISYLLNKDPTLTIEEMDRINELEISIDNVKNSRAANKENTTPIVIAKVYKEFFE